MPETFDIKQAIQSALSGFSTKPLATAATALLNALGYSSKRSIAGADSSPQAFLDLFGSGHTFDGKKALFDEWKTADLLFQLTDQELSRESSLFTDDSVQRGFDTHHIFSVDEFYWNDRPRYYRALQEARKVGDNLTAWLEYSAEGIEKTLTNVWRRIQRFAAKAAAPKLVLRPRQEQLFQFLRDRGPMTPAEIWAAIGVSKQGSAKLIKPLLDAGLIVREGTRKNGRYRLANAGGTS